MNNMMNNHDDYSSSSYSSDNDMFDMFSDMFDTTHKMDNYRSSSDYKNPMGRMSQFKNMFNSMRFKRVLVVGGAPVVVHLVGGIEHVAEHIEHVVIRAVG